jgi:hypothetical protein
LFLLHIAICDDLRVFKGGLDGREITRGILLLHIAPTTSLKALTEGSDGDAIAASRGVEIVIQDVEARFVAHRTLATLSLMAVRLASPDTGGNGSFVAYRTLATLALMAVRLASPDTGGNGGFVAHRTLATLALMALRLASRDIDP